VYCVTSLQDAMAAARPLTDTHPIIDWISNMWCRMRGIGAVAAILAGTCLQVHAQWLPSEPFVFGDGTLTVSGDVSVTASCSHAQDGPACTSDTGFFNYSDYENSALRTFRAGVNAAVRVNTRVSVLGDLRMENTEPPKPYGLYVRVRPFPQHDFDIQIGRVPSTFGAFPRRTYSSDNPLIGYPLAYQYLLSLRTDALPASVDDLFRMRGRGWLSTFPIGNHTADAGIPIADALRWDTGIQVHAATTWLEGAGSVTVGSLAKPLVTDDNDGHQFAGRVVLRPVPGLVIGVSGSRAPYVSTAAANAAGMTADRFVQSVLGTDVEYSRDHYVVRMELVDSHFRLGTIDPRLDAVGTAVEGRYKLTPRFYMALRGDHLGFNTVTGTTRSDTWEAPVTRWELGGGYMMQRNVQLRLSVQHNTRDGGRVHRLDAFAAQLLYWF
jgi:hypothetical protein